MLSKISYRVTRFEDLLQDLENALFWNNIKDLKEFQRLFPKTFLNLLSQYIPATGKVKISVLFSLELVHFRSSSFLDLKSLDQAQIN